MSGDVRARARRQKELRRFLQQGVSAAGGGVKAEVKAERVGGVDGDQGVGGALGAEDDDIVIDGMPVPRELRSYLDQAKEDLLRDLRDRVGALKAAVDRRHDRIEWEAEERYTWACEEEDRARVQRNEQLLVEVQRQRRWEAAEAQARRKAEEGYARGEWYVAKQEEYVPRQYVPPQQQQVARDPRHHHPTPVGWRGALSTQRASRGVGKGKKHRRHEPLPRLGVDDDNSPLLPPGMSDSDED